MCQPLETIKIRASLVGNADLETFQAKGIARQPVFRRHVRSLIYIGERIHPRFEDYEEWKTHALHVSTDAVAPIQQDKYYRLYDLGREH